MNICNKINEEKNQCVTRLIVLRNVIKIAPMFKGDKYSPKFMDQACSWLYYGFKKRYNLSYKQISGASRKLPPG